MTAEDGSTQAVTHTVADTNNNTTAAAVQAACASSSQSLFQQVTFTVATDTVTVTAALAGRPFTLAVTDDGSTAYTVADPTANAGPNDWNTAANWSGSTKPASDDLVAFTDGSFDVLYGLDQSAVVLYQMSVSEGFTGNIGTRNAALRIQTDASHADAEQTLNLAGSGFMYNFSGDFPIVNVSSNRATLKIAGEISETNLVGGSVSGNITVDSVDSTTNGNALTVSNVSPACKVVIPSTATNTGDIRMDSGLVECSAVTKAAKSSLMISGGTFVTKDSGQIATNAASLGVAPAAITVVGGTYRHESDADLAGDSTRLAVYNGLADFSKVRAKTSGEFLALGNVKLFGGVIDKTAAGNLTSFTALTKAGGTVLQPASSIANSAKR
tara:strand:+ start:6529 stop:7680 length:1152 start_codon:yes stop_codon:yes gene_type:complete